MVDKQQQEEERLLMEYLNGDNRSFGPLYYRYRNIFFYHINRQEPNMCKEDKEDLAIDFLGKISGRLYKYDKNKSLFRTWMTTCILNHIKEYKSKKSTENKKVTKYINRISDEGEEYDITISSDENPLENVSYMNIIRLIKNILIEDDWKIFELHFLQGYNQRESARKLKLREETIWYRIKRIREQLDGINNIK